MRDVRHAQVTLPEAVRSCIRDLMDGYKLRFGAIDMAIDTEDNWVFFEINPNGQWAWMDLNGVTDIASSFVRSFS